MKYLSEIPHIAGKDRDKQLVDFIKDKFESFGLDHVEVRHQTLVFKKAKFCNHLILQTKSYRTLLDYPNPANPNLIHILNSSDPAGNPIFTTSYQEDGLGSAQGFVDGYLAYSKAGQAEGQLVYVNYGTKEDFELLTNPGKYNTDLSDKICIARYGSVSKSLEKLHSPTKSDTRLPKIIV